MFSASKWPGPLVLNIPIGDAGYKGKINEQTGQVDNINGTKMWAGLYQSEIESWQGQPGVWNDPKLWSGIDCIGFVLRTMEAASDSLPNSGITFPEICTTYCANMASITTDQGMDWINVPKFSKDLKGKAHYFMKKEYNEKIRLGDVVFYPNDTHITIVWSARWGKSISDSKANYDVIHALGYECEEDDEKECKGELWFRKVGITSNKHRGLNKKPYGFGRIILWD